MCRKCNTHTEIQRHSMKKEYKIALRNFYSDYLLICFKYIGLKVTSDYLVTPRDCSPPGFLVYRIPQARILEWVAISFSWGSSQPSDQTHISCNGRWVLYHWATREDPNNKKHFKYIGLNKMLFKLISPVPFYFFIAALEIFKLHPGSHYSIH